MGYNLQAQSGAHFCLSLPSVRCTDLQDNLAFLLELYMLAQDSEQLQGEIW